LKNIKETNLSIVVLVNVVLTAEEGFARNAIVVLLVFCIWALFTLSVANKVITLCEVHVAPSHVLLILRTKVSYSWWANALRISGLYLVLWLFELIIDVAESLKLVW